MAVADSPAGPYRDPIHKPLVKGWFKIDPTVFIDDNGQAYLFYGNNMLWYTRLAKNMTSIMGGEIEVKTKDESAFGPFKGYEDNGTPKTNFEEASWVYKRGGKYYIEYAAGGVPPTVGTSLVWKSRVSDFPPLYIDDHAEDVRLVRENVVRVCKQCGREEETTWAGPDFFCSNCRSKRSIRVS